MERLRNQSLKYKIELNAIGSVEDKDGGETGGISKGREDR